MTEFSLRSWICDRFPSLFILW